jgi:hypothetical protein
MTTTLKDYKIQNNLYMKFELSETQLNKLREWQEAIHKIYGESGSYTYTFNPTGIGDIVKVETKLMGNRHVIDLTELEKW